MPLEHLHQHLRVLPVALEHLAAHREVGVAVVAGPHLLDGELEGVGRQPLPPLRSRRGGGHDGTAGSPAKLRRRASSISTYIRACAFSLKVSRIVKPSGPRANAVSVTRVLSPSAASVVSVAARRPGARASHESSDSGS